MEMEKLFDENGNYTNVASDLSAKIHNAVMNIVKEYFQKYPHREISHVAMLATFDATLNLALGFVDVEQPINKE